MNQNFTVDVSPRRVKTLRVEETISALWPIRTADGTIKMVPVSPTSAMMMTVIPAVIMGDEAAFAPERTDLAAELFGREIGNVALVPTGTHALTRPQRINPAGMVTMMRRQSHVHAQALVANVHQQIRNEDNALRLMGQIAPFAVFPARAVDDTGVAVLFAGKPSPFTLDRIYQVDGFGGFLNAPWHLSPIARELETLGRKANEYLVQTLPCHVPRATRQKAQTAWAAVMTRADQVAKNFLVDHAHALNVSGVGFSPTIAPWMSEVSEISMRLNVAALPTHRHTVGGCHRLAG